MPDRFQGGQEPGAAPALRVPSLLGQLRSPADLRALAAAELTELAGEIREFLVSAVARTGGHLGSNLGAVELTLAVHRVFDSPTDTVLWDTGHQAYVHKLITGRAADFVRLRRHGGLSGYPSRTEGPHDVIENSHASVALSYADGLAKARRLAGERDRRVVVVVGDGALTGGVAWEALNNLGAAPEAGVVVVLNDNGRSYCPTVGGLAAHLAAARVDAEGESDRTPGGVFTAMGLAYLGPVDGHDVAAMEAALEQARALGRPAVVHCVTEKGRGFAPAEADPADRMHGPPPFDPGTGRPRNAATPTWTGVFGAELAEIATENPAVVAITAAMRGPVGLERFTREHPERVFDVGIAEQHAVASAAGLALGGQHPVVCVYATFLNRAFDQLLMDVALHRLPVTVVLDRAGVTGEDGASHHGMWDLAALSVVPGLRVAAPRDGTRLRELLREAVEVPAPTVVRFPKGSVPAEIEAVAQHGDVDVLRGGWRGDVLLVAAGATAELCLDAAAELAQRGVEAAVVDPRWVLPVSADLVDLAARHRLVVTVEDGCRNGGVGSALADALADRGAAVPVRRLGLPQQFLHQGSRAEVMRDVGLTAAGVVATVADAWTPRGVQLAVAG